jgi:DNA polymerase-3 subunit alpha
MTQMPVLDTCTEVTASLLKLPGGQAENSNFQHNRSYINIFQPTFAEAHNATADVEATTRCFFELIRTEILPKKNLNQNISKTFKLKNQDQFS